MIKYAPNFENDVALCMWWQELLRSNDIVDYPSELRMMSCFFESLQEPTTLLVESDAGGIWFAFWYRPSSLPFAIVNLWVRDGMRHQKQALMAVHLSLANVFQEHGTIVAYCGDPKVTGLYEGFGLGRHAPDIYVGTHAITVLSLTREQYQTMQRRSA